MLALLGISALVIDIGRVSVAAQQVQAVMDAAALAGAAKLPTQDDAEASLQRTILANNMLNPAWMVSCVPSNDVTYYAPGAIVPGYGTLEDEENAITVTGRAVVDYTFARIFGINSATVVRSATANARSGGSAGGEGIFFGNETGRLGRGIVISGSHHHINGTMHSNSRLKFTGSNHTVTGDVEYLHDLTVLGSGTVIEGDKVESTVQPWPVNFTWAQFANESFDYIINDDLRLDDDGATLAAGNYRIHGDIRIRGSDWYIHDSLFVVDDDVWVYGNGHVLENCTIVAQEEIVFLGSTDHYSPLVDGLFAMSIKNGNAAIRFSGSGSDTTGILFAPNGELSYTGSANELHRGALIANDLDINGSQGRFSGTGGGGSGGGKPSIELIK